MGKKRELTLERRVGLELLKLFIRYQIDLRILVAKRQTTSNLEKQHSRGKRSDSDTSTDEEHGLVLQKVLRCRAEGTIHHDAREDAVHRWADVRTHDPATSCALLALLALSSALFVKVAAERFGEFTGEIADDADVYRNVVFLWRTDILGKKSVRVVVCVEMKKRTL